MFATMQGMGQNDDLYYIPAGQSVEDVFQQAAAAEAAAATEPGLLEKASVWLANLLKPAIPVVEKYIEVKYAPEIPSPVPTVRPAGVTYAPAPVADDDWQKWLPLILVGGAVAGLAWWASRGR